MPDLEQRLAVLSPHLYGGVSLVDAAERAGVPLRTATRRLAAYRADGAAGLTRSARVDRGGRRLPGELIELIEGLALRRPPPRVAEVHRAVTKIAGDRGWRAPSYQSVRRIVQGLDHGLDSHWHITARMCTGITSSWFCAGNRRSARSEWSRPPSSSKRTTLPSHRRAAPFESGREPGTLHGAGVPVQEPGDPVPSPQ